MYRDVQDILSQPAAKEQLQALGLTPVAKRKAGGFSTGMRQRYTNGAWQTEA